MRVLNLFFGLGLVGLWGGHLYGADNPGKIAWHGTWKGGLAEAKRTGKPIMLVSAVPQCHSVPGVW